MGYMIFLKVEHHQKKKKKKKKTNKQIKPNHKVERQKKKPEMLLNYR